VGTLDRLVAGLLPYVPKGIVGRVSARYIAGERLEDAVAAAAALNGDGTRATIDVLGEFVADLAAARRARDEYVALLEALASGSLDAQVSVKPTQLGLKLDPGACLENLRALVRRAAALANLVTLDMEDSSCTDATLACFKTLRAEGDAVGAVLQACLRRSRADLEALLPLEPNLRICKGIYVEPESIAYRDREAIRDNFMALVERLLRSAGFAGIATHDETLLGRSQELLRRLRIGPERYEFQMLLGVRADLRRRLLAAGHPVRVYVPYGAEWYAYSLRRLKENPAIAGHVFRNLFERGFRTA
jgi:proline dehydrogenase